MGGTPLSKSPTIAMVLPKAKRIEGEHHASDIKCNHGSIFKHPSFKYIHAHPIPLISFPLQLHTRPCAGSIAHGPVRIAWRWAEAQLLNSKLQAKLFTPFCRSFARRNPQRNTR